MSTNDKTIPELIVEKPSYSGKFRVKIPPEQHRMLVLKAAEVGISLNRYISAKLAT